MKPDLRSFMPNRISGQIAIIIVASLLLIHVVLTAAFFLTRRGPPPQAAHEELATLIELIAAGPQTQRAALLSDIGASFPNFDLALADRWPEAPPVRDMEAEDLARRLGANYSVTALPEAAPADPDRPHQLAIRLKDGAIVTARLMAMTRPPVLGSPVAITLMAIAVSATLLAVWAARGLVGPLRRFAWAAENFDPIGEIALLPERGPHEVRAAARALNRMRERIRSLIEDRTRMLAAVSHDLRTPRMPRPALRCSTSWRI
jgi:signal transduction histidine kinase